MTSVGIRLDLELMQSENPRLISKIDACVERYAVNVTESWAIKATISQT